MGRTALVRRQYRSQCRTQERDKAPETPEQSEKITFPRRFPRIGSQFQTKIARKHGRGDASKIEVARPPPALMSTDHPFLTEKEAECNQIDNQTTSNVSRRCRQDSEFGTSRGGLLLHKASSTEMDRFQSFARPLFQSYDDTPSTHVTEELWKQSIIQLHSTESSSSTSSSSSVAPKKRNRAPRGGGVKRKRVEEELVWGLETMIQEHQTNRRQRRQQDDQQQQQQQPRRQCYDANTISVPEDDARALEYLQLHHNGNAASAELTVLVDVSSGRASKIHKCIQHNLIKDNVKLPPATTSQSWRTQFERTFPAILGQVQDDPPLYPVRSRVSDVTSSSSSDREMENMSSDADDLKGAWRSVLACGKSMERQLNGDASGHKKPLLSTVVLFIRNAYGLPTPERCFGSLHVIIEELSNCMLNLLNHIETARYYQAKLRDILFDESGEGIDIDALQKFLDSTGKVLSVRLDEADHLYRYREVVTEWDRRLNAILERSNDVSSISEKKECGSDLERVQRMLLEAERCHGFSSKSVVQLSNRINKALQIRRRILDWKKASENGDKSSIKFVAALVRDSNRLKLNFPEIDDLMAFHQRTESWVDRANIAIRSRISLTEIKSLIQRGEEMPLNLSDYSDKLKSRARIAEEWIQDFKEVVPPPTSSEQGNAEGTTTSEPDMLEWMKDIRDALYSKKYSRLHELALEGSRIPVEVDLVKLLQVEFDAKNWTLKARKWIPLLCDEDGTSSTEPKRGKLEDLRDHASKGVILRDRLTLSDAEKASWVLKGESELLLIVQRADTWLAQNKPFLEGDNRKSQRRCCVSIEKLRSILDEGQSIHVNLGNATSKVGRILAQADSWYNKHETLLVRCSQHHGTPKYQPSHQLRRQYVHLTELTKAVESAASGVSLDLDEALELKSLIQKIEKWFDRATVVAPKRVKRHGRSARTKCTVDDLISLIGEASSLPVDTSNELKRLEMQLNSIQTWRSHASHELVRIVSGFHKLRESINLAYGPPKEFSRDYASRGSDDINDDPMDVEKSDSADGSEQSEDQSSQNDSASNSGSEQDEGSFLCQISKGEANVHRIIKGLQKGAKSTGVITAEAKISEVLDEVSRWCLRSLKYLDSPREVFDKRFFGAFDRFIMEGKQLHEKSKDCDLDLEEKLSENIRNSWGGVVADQLERLELLRSEREQFTSWCETAGQVFADEKKLTTERLQELADQSRHFPAVSDMVQKVRGLSVKVGTWVDSTRKVFKSGKKLSMQDAKAMLDAGEKLNVNCQELKALRAALRSVRSWANRVKRCNLDQGAIHVNSVKDLIKEHDSFIVEMPEELSRLKQATRNYCICRRPYDGFMIGCDECDEWYHGPCIGVSESRADRFDKYICVRCSVSNVFKSSASTGVGVIRKWTCPKDLKKARQVESQKHQRKVRKETKDIEKLRAEIKKLEGKLPNHPSVDDNGLTTDQAVNGSLKTEAGKDDLEVPDVNTSQPGNVALDCDQAPKEKGRTKKKEDTASKLTKARNALKVAEERHAALASKSTERKHVEKIEESCANSLRRWCIRVRSSVLVPSTPKQAECSRPISNGSLSNEMLAVIDDAEIMGISHLPDVDVMINCFKCMSWSLFTLSVLRRKPKLLEISSVVSQASSLRLPDEKALRTMKSMIQRASQLQAKVGKALAPKPGQTKPLNLDVLKELLSGAGEIPLRIPETAKLLVAIEDKGARHCVCGGPSDGSFMLCCDKCESWFHGACVNVSKAASEKLKKWLCSGCSNKPHVDAICSHPIAPVENNHEEEVPLDAVGDDSEDVPGAPDPVKMWPPFGLLSSNAANEALGNQCAAIPDEVGTIDSTNAIGNEKQERIQDTAKEVGGLLGQDKADELVVSQVSSSSLRDVTTMVVSSMSSSTKNTRADERSLIAAKGKPEFLANSCVVNKLCANPDLESIKSCHRAMNLLCQVSACGNELPVAAVAVALGAVQRTTAIEQPILGDDGEPQKNAKQVPEEKTENREGVATLETPTVAADRLEVEAPRNGAIPMEIDNQAESKIAINGQRQIGGIGEVSDSILTVDSQSTCEGEPLKDCQTNDFESQACNDSTKGSSEEAVAMDIENSTDSRSTETHANPFGSKIEKSCIDPSSQSEIPVVNLQVLQAENSRQARGLPEAEKDCSESVVRNCTLAAEVHGLEPVSKEATSGLDCISKSSLDQSSAATFGTDKTVEMVKGDGAKIGGVQVDIPLSLEMKVEVKSPRCQTVHTDVTEVTNDATPEHDYIGGIHGSDSGIQFERSAADSNQDKLTTDAPSLGRVVPDILVAIKEASG